MDGNFPQRLEAKLVDLDIFDNRMLNLCSRSATA